MAALLAFLPVSHAQQGPAAEPSTPPAQASAPIQPIELETIRVARGVPALAARGVAWDESAGRAITSASGQAGTRAAGVDVPVGPDDLWHIGSCTKAFTATLLATYVAEGKLAWDDTLASALPEYAEHMSPPLKARTVADLVRHRAGLPANASRALFAQLRSMDTASGRLAVVREALQNAVAVQPTDPPAYSNTGFVVAGVICERLGGKPWEDLVAERVLSPLGISREQSGFGPPPAGGDPARPMHPVGHTRVGQRWMPMPPGPLADNPAAYGPAGTLHLTMDAWARFAMAHARGDNLPQGQRDALGLAREDYAELHREQMGMAAGWLVGQRPWAKGPQGTGVVLSHAGSNTYWFAVVWIAPERDVVLLSAANAAGQAGPAATDEAVGAVLKGMGP